MVLVEAEQDRLRHGLGWRSSRLPAKETEGHRGKPRITSPHASPPTEICFDFELAIPENFLAIIPASGDLICSKPNIFSSAEIICSAAITKLKSGLEASPYGN